MSRRKIVWEEEYRSCDALWLHDGDMCKPHVLLSAGQHSNGFFNAERIAEWPSLLAAAADNLVVKLKASGLLLKDVDCVVGPAMGAIDLAALVALAISKRRKKWCRRAYSQKTEWGGHVMERTRAHSGDRVLVVEDALSTGKNVCGTIRALRGNGIKVLPYIGVLFNRSRLSETAGRPIVSLVHRPIQAYEPDVCPYCRKGSRVIKVDSDRDWKELTAGKEFVV